jgi:hypothetical protein
MFFILEISGRPQAVSVDNIRLQLGSAPVSARFRLLVVVVLLSLSTSGSGLIARGCARLQIVSILLAPRYSYRFAYFFQNSPIILGRFDRKQTHG